MGKYFKYAIDEIILVLIGILIALQINNWNENQKLKQEEQEILASLKEELTRNKKEFNNLTGINTYTSKNTEALLKSIKIGQQSIDKLKIIMAGSHNSSVLAAPVLDKILDNDEKLITTKKILLSDLRSLQSSFKTVKKAEYYLDENWNLNFSKFLIQTGLELELDVNSKEKVTFKELKQHHYNRNQFLSLVKGTQVLRSQWLVRLEASEKINNTLLEKLEGLE